MTLKPLNMEEFVLAIETLIETAPELARLRRKLYDAHIKEGFSPEEALILCQKVTA